MRKLLAILPHCTIVLSLLFVIFLILDFFNPLMNFAGNSVSQKLLFGLCILSLLCAARLCAADRRKARESCEQPPDGKSTHE